jgi:hypothetical protein
VNQDEGRRAIRTDGEDAGKDNPDKPFGQDREPERHAGGDGVLQSVPPKGGSYIPIL